MTLEILSFLEALISHDKVEYGHFLATMRELEEFLGKFMLSMSILLMICLTSLLVAF